MTTNKIAVVTGGSRGIGAAIAKKLAAQGTAVAIVYRGNRAQADSVVGRGNRAYLYATVIGLAGITLAQPKSTQCQDS